MDRTKKYFARIGLDEDTPVTKTYEFLCKLQLAHVTTVPYENLDILKTDDFKKYGSQAKIASYFGGKLGYLNAVHSLGNAIYGVA